MTRLRLEALAPDLSPVGIIAGWTECALIRRRNRLGTWTFDAPSSRITGDIREALAAGGHVQVWDLDTPDLPPVMAGPVESPASSWGTSDPWGGSLTISGVDDHHLLEDREARPLPSAAHDAQTVAYDVRNGVAETVLKGYADANAGQAARAERRVPGVSVAPSLARGTVVKEQARWDNLLELAQRIANAGGINFEWVRDGNGARTLEVTLPTVRDDILLTAGTGSIVSGEVGTSAPTATRAFVLGQGEGAARTVREVTTTLSLAAETSWGRRIERSFDRRDSDDPAILDLAGAEQLADAGATGSLSVTIADTPLVQWRRHYELGDFLPWSWRGVELLDAVQEVRVNATPDTTRVAPVLGPAVPVTGPSADVYARLRALEAELAALKSRR